MGFSSFFLPDGMASSLSYTWLSWDPLISIHDRCCFLDPEYLLYSAHTSVAFPVNHQLFLLAWSVIADSCSIAVNSLLCSPKTVWLWLSRPPSCVPQVLQQMFSLFHHCVCDYSFYKESDFCWSPLCRLNALVFSYI